MPYFLKLQGCGSKIEPAIPFWILDLEILKWAWQAHFFSHAPVIFENYVFFIVIEMILITFFDIPNLKSVIW